MNKIGDRIKFIRKELGLTLEKFGEPLGVKKAAVSTWENSKTTVTNQMKIAICREYNVNSDWLENGLGEPFISKSEDMAGLISDMIEKPDDEFYQAILELVRTYQQLGPDSRKVLLEFAKKYSENIKNRKE